LTNVVPQDHDRVSALTERGVVPVSSPQGSVSKPPGQRVDLTTLPMMLKVMGTAAAAAAIAAFLPWASAFGVSVTGVSGGDGVITLIGALVGLAVLAAHAGFGPVRIKPRMFAGIEIVLGAIVAIIGIVDLSGFAAFGIYLTLIAGVVWVIAAAMTLRGTAGAPAPLPPPPSTN
jgi:hypothetical protein